MPADYKHTGSAWPNKLSLARVSDLADFLVNFEGAITVPRVIYDWLVLTPHFSDGFLVCSQRNKKVLLKPNDDDAIITEAGRITLE